MKMKPVDKDMRIARLEDEVRRLQAIIDTLTPINVRLPATAESLNGTIPELSQVIKELKELPAVSGWIAARILVFLALGRTNSLSILHWNRTAAFYCIFRKAAGTMLISS